MERVIPMYFSPTGTTKKIVSSVANLVSISAGVVVSDSIDFTLPAVRNNRVAFADGDVVIVGVPVYAGRVPNVLLKYLNSIAGNGALAVAVVVYGNRNYDDALIELKDILEASNFKLVAGGAFIGEHSFSKILAQNRPDEKDMSIVSDFAAQIYSKIVGNNEWPDLIVKGNRPYRRYYMPKNKNDELVDIRKVAPKTNGNCADCKLCAAVCPMGSIDYDDVASIKGVCIKCCACEKKCPNQAKYFDDNDYLRHKYELEVDFRRRSEPELFI